MKTPILSALLLTSVLVFSACGNNEASTEAAAANENVQTAQAAEGLELIQFHSEHRCMTCNKIESLTLETLRNFEDVPFRLVNVDDASNAEESAKFEAAGTALFLHNTKTGEKKELTDFAFMTAHDDAQYVAKLREEIASFN